MTKILFDVVKGGCTRVAVIDSKQELQHYDEESKYSKMEKNSIYHANICSIRPEIGACFVKYDSEKKDGFLPFDNIAPHFYGMKESAQDPAEVAKKLKVGQKVLVQVKKDQISHDSKGAALTTYISLAGTYLVLLPHNNKQTVSRKADTQQRDHVTKIISELEIPDNIGVIIRTAGINRSKEELAWDYQALLKQWESIQQMYQSSSKPELLHEEDSIIARNIRDNISLDTHNIVVNDQDAYNAIHNYLENTRPEIIAAGKLELYTHDKPMYGHYSVEEQVEAIFNTSIELPSGGSIVVQGTEAGYMIDVNSGKSTVGANIDETALNTNLEAARAAAKIMKLRDIGGIIILDFIDMSDREDQKKVEKAFEDAVASDRAKIKFEPISPMNGVMNLLRQRLGTPFFESSLTAIEDDQTIIAGKKRSVDSYAGYLLHVIENSAYHDTNVIQLQLPTDVATFILNEERHRLAAIEKQYGVDIKIIPNANFKSYRYTLKRFRIDGAEAMQELPKSYEQIIEPTGDQPWAKVSAHKRTPHIRQGSYSHNVSQKQTQANSGIFSRILQSVFGTDEKASAPAKKRGNERRHHQKRGHKKNNQTGHRNRATNFNKEASTSSASNNTGNSYDKGSTRGAHGGRRRQNRRPRGNNAQQPNRSEQIVNENVMDQFND